MKKSLLLILVFASATTGAFAQLSGGLRAGASLTNLKLKVEDVSQTYDSKIGFQVGAYLTANVGDKVAIQPELTYSTMGAKSSNDGDSKLNLGYISLPVFVRYNISDIINIHVGPQVGFLASAKAKDDNDSEDIKDQFKGIDFGATVGIGLDFGPVNAGLRYYQGLSNIADIEEAGNVDFKFTNSGFQLFVGYRLFGK